MFKHLTSQTRPRASILSTVSCILSSSFCLWTYQLNNSRTSNHYIPIENSPLINPAQEAGDAFRHSQVEQATIHVKRVQEVHEGWAHQILSKEQRAIRGA